MLLSCSSVYHDEKLSEQYLISDTLRKTVMSFEPGTLWQAPFPLCFHRELTVRRWWVCCQDRRWVSMVSSCLSLCPRSTCPGCGWRNTLTRTARSVCLSVSVVLSFPPSVISLKPSSSPPGLHVGLLSRLWRGLQFCVQRSRPLAGHIWVHEGRASQPRSENRHAGSSNPGTWHPSQYHFVWLR